VLAGTSGVDNLCRDGSLQSSADDLLALGVGG
jgi:hypothetical protein